MLTVTGKTYEEIHIEFLKERKSFLSRKERRDQIRAKLSEKEREALDNNFSALFMKIVYEGAENVDELEDMLERGATTTAFEDYELTSQPNLAKALREWLIYKTEEGIELPDTVAKALNITVEAGDAFLTNRFYVGNGGDTLIHLIFYEYFRAFYLPNHPDNPETKKRSDFAEQLLYKITAQAGSSYEFWSKFIFDIGFHYTHYVNNGGKHHERNLLRFYTYCFLYHSGGFFQRFFNEYESHYSKIESFTALLVKIVLSAESLRADLLQYADARKGIFSRRFDLSHYNSVLKDEIDKVIGIMLSTASNRKIICQAINDSKWLRKQFLNSPKSIFRIAREKTMLKIFLKKERQALLELRDNNGNDLLLHTLKLKGKTENNIKLLLGHGFGLDTVDNHGNSARSILETRKDLTIP
ncbi:hypothetical protein FUAX_32590 [Fulvitalea axinellae]|uniref:Ankyrin repeat protein n=1 Tax=Fulvitalea axinellae TaxID=1182444 RepID=A0AAU9CS54_9BACT|nr:hypothetical protein FUAX_32590 [Fulvitalea axinellae]